MRRSALIAALLGLTLLLLLGNTLISPLQRSTHDQQVHAEIMRMIVGVEGFLTEHLLLQDYAAVEVTLRQWLNADPRIHQLHATLPNGLALLDYIAESHQPGMVHMHMQEHHVEIEGQPQIHLLVGLHSGEEVALPQLQQWIAIISSSLISIGLGMLLWQWFRRTALQPLQRELADSEARYRSIFHHAPVSLIIIDRYGVITDVNPYHIGVLATAGQGREALCGLTISALPCVVAAGLQQDYLAVLQGVLLQVEGVVVPDEEGLERYLNIRGVPLQQDGRNEGAIFFHEDVTAARQAELAQLHSERMLRTVLDTVPQQVFWKGVDLNYMGCNSRFSQAAGYIDPAEIIGKSDEDMIWTAHAALYRQDDQRVIDSGISRLHYIEPFMNTNGDTCLIEMSKVPLLDEHDHIIGLLGSFTDVTERVQIERELCDMRSNLQQRVEQRTQLLQVVAYTAKSLLEGADWQQSQNAVLQRLGLATGAERVYIFMNYLDSQDGRALCSQVSEWAAANVESQIDNPELQGISLMELGYGRWVEKLGHGEPITGLIRDFPPAERLDLAHQHIQSIAVMPIMVAGGWWGFIGFDLCSRATQWSESELIALQITADLFGAAIARQQGDNELECARLDAERSSRAKSDFLAKMSHEIRTPMNGVLGMVNLLRRTPLNQQQAHYTHTILRSGQTLLTIINDILDFSRIEAGQMVLEYAPFRLLDLLSDLSTLFGDRLVEAELELQLDVAPELPAVIWGDGNRLNQVLYNLIGNAIKFSRASTIHIRLTTNHTAAGALWLRCEVEDHGAGIEAEKLAHLFEAFYQAHSGEQWHSSGTGLGLAICRSLIQAMGGEISVTSQLGQGSCFTFTIPLHAGSEAQLLEQRDVTQTEEETKPCRYAAKVLLVEDNPVNQDVAKGTLELFGCQVVVANNGQEGVDAYLRTSFDLVLMDFSMPVMDGLAATRRIREFEQATGLAHRPVIALTAHAVTGIQQQGVDAGMDDYVTKPFSIPQIGVASRPL